MEKVSKWAKYTLAQQQLIYFTYCITQEPLKITVTLVPYLLGTFPEEDEKTNKNNSKKNVILDLLKVFENRKKQASFS